MPGLVALIEGDHPSGRYRAARSPWPESRDERPGASRRSSSARSRGCGPPEERGLTRDGVRLMVAHAAGRVDRARRSTDLPSFLDPGDLLVVNTSAHAPGGRSGDRAAAAAARGALLVAVPRRRALGRRASPRPPARAPAPFDGVRAGDSSRSRAARRSTCATRTSASGCGSRRPGLRQPGSRATSAGTVGRSATRTSPATGPSTPTRPSSASSPAAPRCRARDGRSPPTLAALAARGVRVTPIVLHSRRVVARVHESPLPERFAGLGARPQRVNGARGAGGRVVAIGTTAVRALESAADATDNPRHGDGWTDVVITPDRGVTAVDGLLTGWHEPEASHLDMLEAVAGRDLPTARTPRPSPTATCGTSSATST